MKSPWSRRGTKWVDWFHCNLIGLGHKRALTHKYFTRSLGHKHVKAVVGANKPCAWMGWCRFSYCRWIAGGMTTTTERWPNFYFFFAWEVGPFVHSNNSTFLLLFLSFLSVFLSVLNSWHLEPAAFVLCPSPISLLPSFKTQYALTAQKIQVSVL